MMEQLIFTVTDLNNRIKALIESDAALVEACVRGELSNYKIYPSGHHYFTLKDANSAVRCVMFKSSASRLRFRPENGMGVTVYGRVSVYTRDGAYQVYCTAILPEGMGDLQVAYEQLKAKLQAEGLFDAARKKPLPVMPKRIAVITSAAGAAVRDVIRVLGKRWPLAKVIVLPVRVQGAEAPPEIAGAIKYANRHKVADLIITGRGGGSIEDLWAFNDERVVRAIYASEIPVISAVGHEPDVTISDYVADLRAATPSNAAELAVPDMQDVMQALDSYEIRLNQTMGKRLSELSGRLSELAGRRVMQTPDTYLDTKRMELDFLRNRFTAASERAVSAKKQDYVRLAAALDAMSPLKVLGRGYCIAEDENGGIIKDEAQAEVGERVRLSLSSGWLGCVVEEKGGGA